ncbi:MAG: hypothetical protein IJX99_02070 [Clostridia bacterium]|nr:hypothetical protein [Clostridia bacterium]
MNKEFLKHRLEMVTKQIQIYKTNAIESIEKEEMIPATCDLLIMRDLKEQQLLLKQIVESEGQSNE